ncbi:hypothetical protein [Paraglaciecola sp. 2405UD69-4]|uniref:hypothetical protein n=1 Tax=Paraglaciecola sp. 2405UD69-4 TaxID=3391836 RepID=UPI0039C95F28
MAKTLTSDRIITLTTLVSPIDKRTGETSFSEFLEEKVSIDDYNGLMISPRISAQNFRHRISEPGYFSDWHMAGDATMIIIRTGSLRLGLRSGEHKLFCAGDVFIAKDCLQPNEQFNSKVHGHTAEVIGNQTLMAVHVKL